MTGALEIYLNAAQKAGLGTGAFSASDAEAELDDLLASAEVVPDQLAPIVATHAYELDAAISRHDIPNLTKSLERLTLSLKLNPPSDRRAAILASLAVDLEWLGRPREALAVGEEAITLQRELAAEDPSHTPNLAASLLNLGNGLANLGRHSEALVPTAEAADIYRNLDSAYPGYTQNLAMSLSSLAEWLSKLGHLSEALEPAEESVALYRELVAEHPGHTPNLAASLNKLGIRLANLGRHSEALSPTEEATSLRRELARTNSDYTFDLATSLTYLGVRLAETGRVSEALAPSEEAATLYQRLAAGSPGYTPDLAMSLNNLGIRLSELGRHSEALEPTRKAATLYRELTTENLGHTPNLAASLNNLGTSLADLGRHSEALAPTEEAIALRRELARTNSGYTSDLASSLNNLGIRLIETGRLSKALGAMNEAVTLRRELAASNPVHIPGLATSLNNLGTILSELGHRNGALEPTEESVTLFRSLASANPGNTADLAGSLINLGVRLAELGRHSEGLKFSREAANLYRELATENPGHVAGLAKSLDNLGTRLSEVGLHGEALASSTEGLALFRELATENPGHKPDLARSLVNLGARLSKVGLHGGALASSDEGVTLLRELATENPGHTPDLASSLRDLGANLFELGRRSEALNLTEEAVAFYRELAGKNPGFTSDLASSLNNLAITLSGVGRRNEALKPAKEAVAFNRLLATENPGFTSDLAGSLTNLGTSLSILGRHSEALEPTKEAVALNRHLAIENPGFIPSLAGSLTNLGTSLLELGRHSEALEAAQEAVYLGRQLAGENPGFAPNLAASLNNLGAVQSKLGHHSESLTLAVEAVTIQRELASTSPGHTSHLATALINLGLRLSELGRPSEALEAFAEINRLDGCPPRETARALQELCSLNEGGFDSDPSQGIDRLIEQGAASTGGLSSPADRAWAARDLAGALGPVASWLLERGDAERALELVDALVGIESQALNRSARPEFDQLWEHLPELAGELALAVSGDTSGMTLGDGAANRAKAPIRRSPAQIIEEIRASGVAALENFGRSRTAGEILRGLESATTLVFAGPVAGYGLILEPKTTSVRSLRLVGLDAHTAAAAWEADAWDASKPPQSARLVRTVIGQLREHSGLGGPTVLVPIGVATNLPWQSLPEVGTSNLQVTYWPPPKQNDAAMQGAAWWVGSSQGPTESGRTKYPIPHARDESALVAELAGVTAVEPSSAVEVLRALRNADAFHIACHASYGDPDQPLTNALMVGDDEIGLVALIDDLGQTMPSFIGLSACGSGGAPPRDIDQGTSFASILLALGSRTVLATLWPVGDHSALEFMSTLYRRWAQCGPIGDAFSSTMTDLRGERPFDPTFPAFALYGDPSVQWPSLALPRESNMTPHRNHVGRHPIRPIDLAEFLCLIDLDDLEPGQRDDLVDHALRWVELNNDLDADLGDHPTAYALVDLVVALGGETAVSRSQHARGDDPPKAGASNDEPRLPPELEKKIRKMADHRGQRK